MKDKGDLISREALKKEFEKLGYTYRVTNIIDNAPTVSIESCRECPFVADEEKQITNGDAWKSYCEGQEVGFKKAEYVFERMKLIQETVDCIRNRFNLDTESNKLVRNCMTLVQNAIDGEYHDMEEVDTSELERPQGEWVAREDMGYLDENKVVHKHFACNKCGFIHDFIDGHTSQYSFCPECGARLQKGGAK